MPKDLEHRVTAEMLPKDTSSLLPRLFWKHSPTGRVASATLHLCHNGHFCSLHHPLQGLLNISLSPVFMDAGKTKEVSVELHPHPLRVHSRCALGSCRVWATWQRSHVQSWHQNCTQKHWRQERTSRCFNHLYIPSPNMCTRHSEIPWYETSALCHSLSVLDEICRSNLKY